MKKIICIIMACVMALSFIACNKKDESKPTVFTKEVAGAKIRMEFYTEGDKVIKIDQTTTLELKELSDEQVEQVRTLAKDASEKFAKIEKTSYSVEEKDGQLVEKVIIPTDAETLQAVVSAGLLPVTSPDVTMLSLNESRKWLEEGGWVEEK